MGKYSYYQKVIALLFAWKCLFSSHMVFLSIVGV